ncbi:lipoprotein [Spiroplasma endosymbiont of Glossina fuscipes fuscipes]|uniref:lipoprotein n=1 Tax=Spiroplasma endosymbiont of Glossina fuscipes fuscipes TaxID=2004463 RepID=UPI003C70CE06
MKKLLTILGSFVLTSSAALSGTVCQNQPSGVKPDNDSNTKHDQVDDPTTVKDPVQAAKTKIINKLNRFSELTLMIIDSNDFQTVNADDAFNILKNNFTEFGDDLILKQTNFSKIEVVDESVMHCGQLELTADFKGEELVNPKTEDNNFAVAVTTNDLKLTNETIQKLNQSLTIIFSKMDLPISGSSLSIETILGIVTQVGLFDNLPTVIPTKFNNSDLNWRKWQNFINLLTNLPGVGDFLKDGAIDKTIEQNIIIGTTATITIKAKYLDILNSLASDIIHFRNFVVEQRQQQKSQNLLLLLIQYLFDTPRNINDDGFLDVNKDIDSNNGGKIKFGTNLERILHNLFDGWKNKSNEWSAVRTPISVVIAVKVLFVTTTINIKYEQIPPRWYQVTSGTEGIIDILPVKHVKSFINQLFNYDLNSDLKLTAHIVKWDFNFSIPLSKEIQQLIPTMLKINGHSETAIANSKVKLTSGKWHIEYQDQPNGEWKLANGVDDLATAFDVRINIDGIGFTVKSINDKTILFKTTNEDLHMIFIPDINSKILGS